MVGGASINGRLPVPPAELSWRTRRDIRFTRMLGLPTFSSAFLLRSAFKFLFQWVKRARESTRWPSGNATQKIPAQQSRKVVSNSGWVRDPGKFATPAEGRRQRETTVLLFLAPDPFRRVSLSKNLHEQNRPVMRQPLANHCSQGKSCSNARSSSLVRALAFKAPRRTNLLWSWTKAVNSVKPSSKINICASIETGS